MSRRSKGENEMAALVHPSTTTNENGEKEKVRIQRTQRFAWETCRLIMLRRQSLMKPVTCLLVFAALLSCASYRFANKKLDNRIRNSKRKNKKSRGKNAASNLFNAEVSFPTEVVKVDGEQLMTEAGFTIRPRAIRFRLSNKHEKSTAQKLDPNADEPETTKRMISLSISEIQGQKRLANSDDFDYPDPFAEGDCQPQYEWQTNSYPTCSTIHELDLTGFFDQSLPSGERELVRFLASGGYRSVWMIRDLDMNKKRLALKTLLYSRDFSERNADRHRRDAITAERLTSSPRVSNIYAYCSNTAIFDFAAGGNLESAIEKRYSSWSSTQKLIIAHQVASAIADLHNFDKEGQASVAHTDINIDQFISTSGKESYILNDFNRARFLRWDLKKEQVCPFFVRSNKGSFRSPEEYAKEAETEMIDVYSMGNIFYVLLTNQYPFSHLSRKKVKQYMKEGRRPDISEEYRQSTDPNIAAMLHAIQMCWVQDPRQRSSTREVQRYIESKLK